MILYVILGVVLACVVYLIDGRKIERKLGIKRDSDYTDYDCMVAEVYSDW